MGFFYNDEFFDGLQMINPGELSIVTILHRQVGDLRHKTILDVGCGTGENANLMKQAGAIVYGVDPNKVAIDLAVSRGFLDQEKAFVSSLQHLTHPLRGQFDVATVWLFGIDEAEREIFFNVLSECIHPKGRVLIGVADHELITGPQSIQFFLEKYFGEIRCPSGNSINRYIFSCTSPRLHLAANMNNPC